MLRIREPYKIKHSDRHFCNIYCKRDYFKDHGYEEHQVEYTEKTLKRKGRL